MFAARLTLHARKQVSGQLGDRLLSHLDPQERDDDIKGATNSEEDELGPHDVGQKQLAA